LNQLYRALHMPKKRLVKKLAGYKEIYTIAVRPLPPDDGAAPLPALGKDPYTPLPYTPGFWYADPLLFCHEGRRYLFCEAYDMAASRGAIAVSELDGENRLSPPRIVVREAYHLSFPTVFCWGDGIFMIPESGANHSLNLYRCKTLPDEWEKIAGFPVGVELCDTILLEQTPDALRLLCSETRPENQLYVRYRRYDLLRDPEAESGFRLEEDEAFNLEHRNFDLTSRNAGPLFTHNGQTVHPTQVSTKVDYGVYLQFMALRGGAETPLCAAMPQNVQIEGLDPDGVVGIHTYCRDGSVEIIDARYLRKI